MTFKEKYIKGEITFEEIDEYVYMWGISDEETLLGEFLGLNKEEEQAWVEDSEEALEELLKKQIKMN
jgi:hypothetical protein